MSAPRRVGLVFGGRSVEHEVSVVSARGVARAMGETGLRCVPLAVTQKGEWLSPDSSAEILAGTAKQVEPGPGDDGARVLFSPGGAGLLCLSPGGEPRPLDLDVIFPLVHGWGGEDGRLQGALELAGMPYVGSGVVASATGMDKALSKHLFAAAGLAVGPWLTFHGRDWVDDQPRILERIGELGETVFVKPCNGGSSLGITRVVGGEGLQAAVTEALRHDPEVVVEAGLDAREIECAVLGNERPEASGLGEIVPGGDFYDYAAKYVADTSELLLPAPLTEEQEQEIRRQAIAAYRALKLRGLARVDFLLDRGTGAVFINEVNTLPGFTPISMFPKLWEAAGCPYPRLIERLVDLAFE